MNSELIGLQQRIQRDQVIKWMMATDLQMLQEENERLRELLDKDSDAVRSYNE